jgi:hypothetical protein
VFAVILQWKVELFGIDVFFFSPTADADKMHILVVMLSHLQIHYVVPSNN